MKQIALIGVTGKDWWDDPAKRDFVLKHTPPGYELLNYHARYGTHSMESHVDEAYNAPFILEQIVLAAEAGVNAIVIDCVCDPILDAAREITDTPVIGIRQAAMHLALTLGSSFSIITVQGESLVRCMEEGVRKEGLEGFCKSVRYVDFPVLDIEKDPQRVQSQLFEAIKTTIDTDRADVIILGCTGLSHNIKLEEISQELNVPIIDPFIVGIWTAVTLVESNLSHSKRAYPSPPKKKITEIPSLENRFDKYLKE